MSKEVKEVTGVEIQEDHLTYTGETQPSVEAVAAIEIFRWNMNTWTWSSVHWDAPTHWRIFGNGDWEFYCARFANFRRDHPILDQGSPMHGKFNFRCYDNTNAVVHIIEYGLVSASYKEEKHNVLTRGNDSRFAELLLAGRIASADSWRRITT